MTRKIKIKFKIKTAERQKKRDQDDLAAYFNSRKLGNRFGNARASNRALESARQGLTLLRDINTTESKEMPYRARAHVRARARILVAGKFRLGLIMATIRAPARARTRARFGQGPFLVSAACRLGTPKLGGDLFFSF